MLPANVNFGLVEGRFLVAVEDGVDSDAFPDGIPNQGSIFFNASIPYVIDASADPDPVVIHLAQIEGVLDSEGYLCTRAANGTAGPRGVRLVATNDPDLMPIDWTWNVTYNLSADNFQRAIASHGIAIPMGGTVDLPTVVKVPSSPGYGLPQAEAAAALAAVSAVNAAQDAADAEASALRAEQVAGATDVGVASLLSASGTATRSALDSRLATKADKSVVDAATASNIADTIVKRSSAGNFSVSDPTSPTHAATKGYIDTQTASINATKADKSAVETSLAFKADLVGGKVPVAQLPTDALVTDANVAAQINGAQTGPAIDARITTQATPLVEPIVADYIASQPAVVDAAAAAVDANPKIAELESKVWFKGNFPGTDLFTWKTPGLYWVPSANRPLNWPAGMSTAGGMLEVHVSGSIVTLSVEGYGLYPFTFTTKTDNLSTGTFHTWARGASTTDVSTAKSEAITEAKWFKGNFPGTDVFTWNTPGLYWVPSSSTPVNWPTEMGAVGGLLEVKTNGTITSLQVRGYGTRAYTLTTETNNLSEGTFHPWARAASTAYVDAAVASVSNVDRSALEHTMRELDMKRRRHNTVTTPGVLVLIFDHGLTNFKSDIWPLLQARNLPCTLALNPGLMSQADNAGASYADIKGWIATGQLEPGNHSYSHANQTTSSGYLHAIRASREELELQLDQVVDTWIQPGNTFGDLDLRFVIPNLDMYWETEAGRLIYASHATGTGAVNNGLVPVGVNNFGVTGTWIDLPSGIEPRKTEIQEAITQQKMKVVKMHPQFLNGTGNTTTAELASFLDWVKARVDAGELSVMQFRDAMSAVRG